MRYLSKLSIKSRLIFMLLAVSLGSIMVIGILAWQNAQNALEQSIFNQLTSVRASKAYQIEAYFDTILQSDPHAGRKSYGGQRDEKFDSLGFAVIKQKAQIIACYFL